MDGMKNQNCDEQKNRESIIYSVRGPGNGSPTAHASSSARSLPLFSSILNHQLSPEYGCKLDSSCSCTDHVRRTEALQAKTLQNTLFQMQKESPNTPNSPQTMNSSSKIAFSDNVLTPSPTKSLRCTPMVGTPQNYSPRFLNTPNSSRPLKSAPQMPLSGNSPTSSPSKSLCAPVIQTPQGNNNSSQTLKSSVQMLIAGVPVQFPFEAYAVQKYMMNQVLSAINKAQNCLLESPTGTGKTLALLCSTLAWQVLDKDRIAQEAELMEELKTQAQGIAVSKGNKAATPTLNVNEPKTGTPGTSANTDRRIEESDCLSDDEVFRSPKRKKKSCSNESTPCQPKEVAAAKEKLTQTLPRNKSEELEKDFDDVSDAKKLTKIFYGTRTHKQIAQVVDQLKRTAYAKGVRMTILASRDHTCVNPMVRGQPNASEFCQAFIENNQGNNCSYYTGARRNIPRANLENLGLPYVYDIEDMVDLGRKQKLCPYFALRNLILQSDIIFCPYNYLIDPRIRQSMSININKAIIIMDEAHNIEDTCREVGSLWIKQEKLEEAIKECKDNIKQEINSNEYLVIEDFLQMLNEWMTSHGSSSQYTSDNESTTSMPGQELINKLHIEGITEEKFIQFKDSMALINQAKLDNPDEKVAMHGVVKQTCEGIKTVFNYLYKPENMDKYQAYLIKEKVSQETPEHPASGVWLTKHKRRKTGWGEDMVWKYSLHLLCLSPAIVFSELLEARTVILASGTLSPLDSFQSELNVKFPFVVKGRHVVPGSNIFVSTVASGPQKVDFRGVFENVNKYEYQDDLGRAILETAKIIPHGVLCFFQSYTLMEKLKERWSCTGLLDQLAAVKQTFWEPRKKQEMGELMNEFTSQIQLSSGHPDHELGAILFGVFRGKIAEGIDFSDDNARVVIAVGIPFLNRHHMEVSLKIKFNDENVKNNLLKGNHWYRIQAFRALNQALGRCIRHKDDWGAIILLDARYSERNTQDNLPSWIQQQLQTYQNWDKYVRDMAAFCSQMKQVQDSSR